MSYCDAFRPSSRVSSGKKKTTMKVSKKSGKHSNEKKFFTSALVITSKPAVYTTPNTGKFARVKGWAKKHKCSIACDHTAGRLIKTRSNKIS